MEGLIGQKGGLRSISPRMDPHTVTAKSQPADGRWHGSVVIVACGEYVQPANRATSYG